VGHARQRLADPFPHRGRHGGRPRCRRGAHRHAHASRPMPC
jgi:hypothetical protein